VLAYKLGEAMESKEFFKAAMAERMETSRS